MPVKTRKIEVRVTRAQYDRIIEKAMALGFGSVSDFVRYHILDKDWDIERKVSAIHEFLLGDRVTPPRGYKSNPSARSGI